MDLSTAMNASDVANELELDRITDRPWSIKGCSATSGSGIDEGMNWMTAMI